MKGLNAILFPKVLLVRNRLEKNVKSKTILITGASFGIGKELTLLLGKSGANLILVARTEEKLIDLQNKLSEYKVKVHVFSLDLRDENNVDLLIKKLNEHPIDVFVSNAGLSIRRSLAESLDRFHDVKRTNAINYLAPVQLILGLIPNLKKQKGQIINVSAINIKFLSPPFWSVYQASKTAMDQWFQSAEPELNAWGIKTSSVYLPLVRTRMIAPTEKYNNFPAMLPEQAARILAKMIMKKKRRYLPWWYFTSVPFIKLFFPIYVRSLRRKLSRKKNA